MWRERSWQLWMVVLVSSKHDWSPCHGTKLQMAWETPDSSLLLHLEGHTAHVGCPCCIASWVAVRYAMAFFQPSNYKITNGSWAPKSGLNSVEYDVPYFELAFSGCQPLKFPSFSRDHHGMTWPKIVSFWGLELDDVDDRGVGPATWHACVVPSGKPW